MRGNTRTFVGALAIAAAATGSGCADENGTGPTPAIEIVVSRPTATVEQNTSEAITVTLTRAGGFTGAVGITVTGVPVGVIVTVVPASIAPPSTTSVLTIAAGPDAATGPATLTVHATGAGVAERTQTLALTVAPAPMGGRTAWDFCSAAAVPIWFAVQDGPGAWTRIEQGGPKFEFDITSGRGGVAYVTTADFTSPSPVRSLASGLPGMTGAALPVPHGVPEALPRDAPASPGHAAAPRYDLFIVYGTQPELAALGMEQCVAGRRVSGSVPNLGVRQFADITLGSSSAFATALEPTFQLTGVADGPLDLVASRTFVDPTTFEAIVDRLIIRRGLDLADNSTLPVLDFTAAEAFAPAVADLAVGNLGGDEAFVLSSIVTPGAPLGARIFVSSGLSTGPFRYYGVPAAIRVAGDLHFAAAFTFSGDEGEFRGSGLYFEQPTDRTVTLGPPLPVPDVRTVATAPHVRLRATGSLATAYDRYVRVHFGQPGRSATIEASAAYRFDAATYDLAIPDFTGVAGWSDDWGLKHGVTPTSWFVTGFGFTGPGVRSPTPAGGVTFRFASKFGDVMP